MTSRLRRNARRKRRRQPKPFADAEALARTLLRADMRDLEAQAAHLRRMSTSWGEKPSGEVTLRLGTNVRPSTLPISDSEAHEARIDVRAVEALLARRRA